MIWVAGLVRQSEATVAIFEPGRDCGMPYAPEDGFCALGFQLLSRCQSESRQDHWLSGETALGGEDLAELAW